MMRKLLIGLSIFILITAVVGFLFLRIGRNDFKKSIQFEVAMQHILQNDSILNATGEIIDIEYFGGVIYSDSALIEVKLRGKRKTLIVNCGLMQVNNDWKIVAIEIQK